MAVFSEKFKLQRILKFCLKFFPFKLVVNEKHHI